MENEKIYLAKVTDNDPNKFIVLKGIRSVYLYDKKEDTYILLAKTRFEFHFIEVYTYEDYFCIVENKGLEGIVLNYNNKDFSLELNREDYRPENWSFPIGFYKKANQVYLIHGTLWNRLDITCLKTKTIITQRTVDYKTKTNYMDYFHSLISVSPKENYFVSNGWIWNPIESPTIYKTESFESEYESCFQNIKCDINWGYNWDRPLTWISDNIFAIGCSEELNQECTLFKLQVVFYDVEKQAELERIYFDGFESDGKYGDTTGDFYFNKIKNHLIGINDRTGIYITDMKGVLVYQDKNQTKAQYSEKHNLFYTINKENNKIEILEIEN